jgi:hypothetical protein
MMGENAGKIMPADRICPCFDKRFDLDFGRLALLRHGSCSECLRMCTPRTNLGTHIRHAERFFDAGANSIYVVPAKPTGRANARPMTGSARAGHNH